MASFSFNRLLLSSMAILVLGATALHAMPLGSGSPTPTPTPSDTGAESLIDLMAGLGVLNNTMVYK